MDGPHGHVVPRPDGAKARCGGPALCTECAHEAAQQRTPGEIIGYKIGDRIYHPSEVVTMHSAAPQPAGNGETAWLVLSDHGITAIRYNEGEARRLAEDTRGLLTHVPLDADYRPQLR